VERAPERVAGVENAGATFAWSAVGTGVGATTEALTLTSEIEEDEARVSGAPAEDSDGGTSVPAGGTSVPAGGAEPWAPGGVKSAVSWSAGLGCLAALAFSLKALKLFSPSSGALMAKTMPLLQCLP